MAVQGAQPAARTPPAWALWPATLAAAAASGAALVARPDLLVAAGVVSVAVTGFVLLFAQPRWVLVSSIFLLVAHAIAVLRAEAGLPLTMRTLILLILIGVATRYVLRLEMPAWPRRETVVLALLVLALIVSAALATDVTRAVFRVFEIGDGAALALLMVLLLDRTLWLRRAIWAYVGAAGGLAALAVVQQLTGTYGTNYGGFADVAHDGSLLRSTGPIDANYFGQLLVAAAALAVYLVLASGRRRTRLAAASLGLVCLGALAFTFSRGSLVTAVVVLGVIVRLRRVRLWLPLGAAAVAAVVALLFLPAEARDRVTALAQPVQAGVAGGDPAVRGRFSENLAAVQMFLDHPYVGVGPDNYPERYVEYSQHIGLDSRVEERHAHNLYLEALAEYGVLGAAAFFAVLAFAARGAWRARRHLAGGALLAEGAFVALVAFLVNGLFLQASYPHYLWITIGLALVAGRLGRTLAEAPR
jgi:hypothetical protein